MNLLKKSLFILGLVSISAYAAAKTPSVFSYYAGWSNAAVPDIKFTALLPAFAEMQQNGNSFYTDYSRSGNFQQPSNQGAYKNIHDWATKYADYDKDTGKLYVTYGGGNNTDFRAMVFNATDDQLSNMAGEIKANVKNYWFTGVDLDIEGWWLYNRDQNKAFAIKLAKLVKILRASLDADPQTAGAKILVAVGESAADYPENTSAYDGTMLSFFLDSEAMKAVQYINIMSYNTQMPNFYSDYTAVDKITQSFKNAVGPDNISKIAFGVQPQESAGGPITPSGTIQNLAIHLKSTQIENMFLWGIGAAGGFNPGEYIQAMQRGLSMSAVKDSWGQQQGLQD